MTNLPEDNELGNDFYTMFFAELAVMERYNKQRAEVSKMQDGMPMPEPLGRFAYHDSRNFENNVVMDTRKPIENIEALLQNHWIDC